MKTWQEKLDEEVRRMNAVTDSILIMGLPDKAVQMAARERVCEAIVELVTFRKKEEAKAEAKAKADAEAEKKAAEPKK